jgi:hypothetical protein
MQHESPGFSREGANKSYGTRAFTGNPLILNDQNFHFFVLGILVRTFLRCGLNKTH